MKCVRALLLLSLTGGVMPASVTSSAVAFGSCSPVVPDGCQARPVYVTGDGSGGTIHTVDFNSSTFIDPFGVAVYSGGAVIDGASALSGDSTHYMNVNSNTETISFAAAINYFGLYWGSVDGGNTVTIKKGTNTLLTFTGSQITSGDSYVSFNGTGGTNWDTVVISYTSCCFETDSHAYVLVATGTPEPGTLSTVPSVILTAGLVVCYRRRKRA